MHVRNHSAEVYGHVQEWNIMSLLKTVAVLLMVQMVAITFVDWSSIISSLIVAVPGTIAAIVALLAYLKSNDVAKAVVAVGETVGAVQSEVTTLGQHVNGKMETLLEAVGAKEKAKGVVEGREAVATEKQARVIEAERVEDRADQKEADKVK